MFDIKENLKRLPETPGVYLHKDKLGNIIYVGKAINLKRRVSSYFVNSKGHSSKVRSMVSQISEFEYINCKTEMEALILECNLIKKYEPKYNVLLRDDKTYPYIKITLNEEYPRILKTRIVARDGARYFGPYSDNAAVNSTIELLNKVFMLKRCSSPSFTEDFRPCLNYHINECRGICTGNVSRDEYKKAVDSCIDYLEGRNKYIINELKQKMEDASEKLNFEEAAVYRDYIQNLKALGETQRVTMVGRKDMDMVFSLGEGVNASVVVFSVRDGKLSGRETYYLNSAQDEERETIITEFIKQYYSQLANPPKEILVPKKLKEAELLENMLGTHIHTPERGDKHQLMKLAEKDVIEMSKTLEVRAQTQKERVDAIREALAAILGIKKDVYRVESYDISNTNGVDTVGAMVVFANLKPVKKDYRRFKIKTVEGPDDYASLEEMLYRRLKRAKEGDISFVNLPDLILMDGGQGQVNAALKIIRAMKMDIPVLGMAKDESHRTRALVNSLGEEIELRSYPLMFKYCGTIQEEVHRFAIEYHRSLHNKNTIGSILDEIPGIGAKKRTALLTYFKTVEDIKKASEAELAKCPGINASNAGEIYRFFRR